MKRARTCTCLQESAAKVVKVSAAIYEKNLFYLIGLENCDYFLDYIPLKYYVAASIFDDFKTKLRLWTRFSATRAAKTGKKLSPHIQKNLFEIGIEKKYSSYETIPWNE